MRVSFVLSARVFHDLNVQKKIKHIYASIRAEPESHLEILKGIKFFGWNFRPWLMRYFRNILFKLLKMDWWVFPVGFAAFWTLWIGIAAFLGSDSVPRLNLKRKHVIITGGSDGLGLELSKLLAKKGAHVTIIARDPKKLETAVKEAQAQRQGDVRKIQQHFQQIIWYNWAFCPVMWYFISKLGGEKFSQAQLFGARFSRVGV